MAIPSAFSASIVWNNSAFLRCQAPSSWGSFLQSPCRYSHVSSVVCCSASGLYSSPKTGTVGEDRLRNGAAPGSYWGSGMKKIYISSYAPTQTQRWPKLGPPPTLEVGEEVSVRFNSGAKYVTVDSKAGENLLRLAESCGVMVPNIDFCFEGSCFHCEMEVLGGAVEVGYQADSNGSDVVRSCICPVPKGRSRLDVKLLSDADVWGEGVL